MNHRPLRFELKKVSLSNVISLFVKEMFHLHHKSSMVKRSIKIMKDQREDII